MTILDISSNRIYHEGPKSLAVSLKINSTLNHINLEVCNLKDKGAKDILFLMAPLRLNYNN
jgi:Ran GTPase-activating protein (RanGAP) involved in mRNA processing and transport